MKHSPWKFKSQYPWKQTTRLLQILALIDVNQRMYHAPTSTPNATLTHTPLNHPSIHVDPHGSSAAPLSLSGRPWWQGRRRQQQQRRRLPNQHQEQEQRNLVPLSPLSRSPLVFPSFFELVDVIETGYSRGHGDCSPSLSVFNGADSVEE